MQNKVGCSVNMLKQEAVSDFPFFYMLLKTLGVSLVTVASAFRNIVNMLMCLLCSMSQTNSKITVNAAKRVTDRLISNSFVSLNPPCSSVGLICDITSK